MGLSFDGNGYPLRTRSTIVSILTNPVYLGWYVYNGVIVSKEAHDRIVPVDDFMFAFSRLSKYTLDGEINEEKPKRDMRRGVACDALLENILENDGKSVYVMAHDQLYETRANNDDWKATELAVPVAFLDAEFVEMLLPAIMAAARKQEAGLEEGLAKLWQESYQEKTKEAQDFTKQLAKIDKAIRGWELDKQSAREQEYKPGIDEANRNLKRLHADRTALQAKAECASKEAEELGKCKDLTREVIDHWDTMPFDRKRRFVRLAVAQANVRVVSPHVLRLDITLRDPFYCAVSRYIYCVHGRRSVWSDQELATLRTMYPQATKQALHEALPTRSWKNIIRQAGELGIIRGTRKQNTTEISISLSYADATFLASLGFPLSVTPDMAVKVLPDVIPDYPDHTRRMVQDYLHPEIVQQELMEQYLELTAKGCFDTTTARYDNPVTTPQLSPVRS